MTIVIVSW